ncbi:MAG: RND family transporter [Planctomycetota bacterium]
MSSLPDPNPPPSPDAAVARLVRVRRWVILGFLVALALAAAAGTRLRLDPSPQRIFESQGEDFAALKRTTAVFGRDDDLVLFHVTLERGAFSPAGVAALHSLHAALTRIPELASVDDLTTTFAVRPGQGMVQLLSPQVSLAEARELALASPLVRGRLVSPDGQKALVIARVQPDRERFAELVPAVDACLELARAHGADPDVEIYLTGIPVARVLIARRLLMDQLTFLPICTLAFVLILWAMFRDLRAVLVPLLAVGVALVLTVGLLGATGQPIDIINNVLPVLIFVIGISDAIHLLVRYRHELQTGRPQWEALTITLRHLLVACFLTSSTTAVGFGSLALAKIEILARFGITAAAGVMIAYVVVVLFVPLVLSFLAPHLPPAVSSQDQRVSELSARLGRWVLRWRWAVLAGTAVLVVVAILFARRVHEENNIYEAFPADDPVVEANRRLERDFMGIVPVSVVASWREGASYLAPEALALLDAAQGLLRAQGFSSLSVLDLLRELNAARAGERSLPTTEVAARQALFALRFGLEQSGRVALLDRLLRPQQKMLRISAQAPDEGATGLTARFEAVRRGLEALAPRAEKLGLSLALSGDGPVASDGVNQLIRDLFESLLLAFLIILPTMCVLLRSIPAGLVSIIPNVIPLLLTLGVMGATGMDLRVTSVIVFTISLGLAVDDTIHFMVRFREEWRLERLGPEPSRAELDEAYGRAIERTFRGTGGAIVATTVLLAAGFLALLFSRFPISRTFGLLLEITVIGALFGDLLLLPACLVTFKPFAPARQPGG